MKVTPLHPSGPVAVDDTAAVDEDGTTFALGNQDDVPMRTHIELDNNLLEQVCTLGQFSTKKAAVNMALAEYAKLLKRQSLLALRGQVEWQGDLDRMRANRSE